MSKGAGGVSSGNPLWRKRGAVRDSKKASDWKIIGVRKFKEINLMQFVTPCSGEVDGLIQNRRYTC